MRSNSWMNVAVTTGASFLVACSGSDSVQPSSSGGGTSPATTTTTSAGTSTSTTGSGGSATGSGSGGSATGSSGSGGSGGSAPIGKFVGNITTNGQVEQSFITYWNQITPENEGKWGNVEATHDVMSWGPIDAVHKYAVDHGIPFKQHNFIWGGNQPGWLAGMSQAQQAVEVEQWIQLFCERYPDVALIDVVNEPPPHTTPVVIDALGGAGASGYDWIIKAFQLARKHCPKATLILNDYNVLFYDTANYLKIVNAIKGSGYIDAMGEQAHELEGMSADAMQAAITNVLSTGLPLYITEYDIDVADDAGQQNVMQTQFPVFWNNPKIHGITLWGYVYGATWKANTGLTKNGVPRPALTWLMNYLGK